MRTAVVIPVAVKRVAAAAFTAAFLELFFLLFIFRNLIYLSPSFTGVGIGTGFPICPLRDDFQLVASGSQSLFSHRFLIN
jgi:hypothetical protein